MVAVVAVAAVVLPGWLYDFIAFYSHAALIAKLRCDARGTVRPDRPHYDVQA